MNPTSSSHCTQPTWQSAPYTPYTPPQTSTFYESQSDFSHNSTLHLPTVLPEQTQHEYISTSLTSPAPIFNSAKSDLDPLVSPNGRYLDNYAYYPNNWNTHAQCPTNYNYYNTPNNNQQYLTSGATIIYPQIQYSTTNQNQIHFHLQYLTSGATIIYPQIQYSTTNQNQIHFHLHGSTEKIDQYLNFNETPSLPSTRGTTLEIGQTAANNEADVTRRYLQQEEQR
ncbi:hypothetical protein QE152_g1264 [Popillia japonica]|uniref:Uncharacterized protein n=1 Tax=Popillia japonica TaxID=7064 RepID=A0AAW1N7U1_POPJA